MLISMLTRYSERIFNLVGEQVSYMHWNYIYIHSASLLLWYGRYHFMHMN